jgi:glycosyltransferase involved in cell wall biosynthesis
MTVVYYTQTYYLDAALELLQSLKAIADVHLLIEISQESRRTTIVDIPNLEAFTTIESPEKVIGPDRWPLFAHYLSGLASTHFVVFKHKRGFSLSSLFNCRAVTRLISTIGPDIVHMDTVSVRSLGLFPFLHRQKLVVTVHDPVFHSGEHSWKSDLVRKIFFRKTNKLLFYSSFAARQFYLNHPHIHVRADVIKFQPFSFTRQLLQDVQPRGEYILFFGRLSLYKGIDLLFDAIPAVLKKYPYERFVIAGRAENFALNTSILEHYEGSIEVLNKYFSSCELAKLVQKAKFIVCPYRDATQSGVLMTAFSFGKTVVATNVGAFPEYVRDGHNGLLASPTSDDIATKIVSALSDSMYLQLEKNVESEFSPSLNKYNQQVLMRAYS